MNFVWIENRNGFDILFSSKLIGVGICKIDMFEGVYSVSCVSESDVLVV